MKQPFFSSDGVVEAQPLKPATHIPRIPDERLSPGQCLAIVFVGCLVFWAGLVALFCWAVPFARWLFS